MMKTEFQNSIHQNPRLNKRLAGVSALALCFGFVDLVAVSAAQAQSVSTDEAEGSEDSSDRRLGTVTVSARRRTESLKDVPVSVTAVSGEAQELVAAPDISYLAQSVPNTTLEASRGTNSTLTAFIRGVGQQDPVAGFESGVGIYLDDVYLNRPQGALLDLYDIERIEVLRGPQGTLYGRNSVGGAVKYVTKKPSGEPSLTVKGAVGTFAQTDLVVSGELPVSDQFILTGGVGVFRRDGFGENLTTGQDNYNKDVIALRAGAYWDMDTVQIKLLGDYLEDTSNPKGGYRLIPGLITQTPVLDDVFDTRGGLQGINEAEAYGATLTFDWQLAPNWTFKSITAWREDERFQQIDFDALPVEDVDVPVVYENEQFTQEFQLLYEGDAISGLAGAYYIDATAAQNGDIILGLAGSFLNLPRLNANLSGDVATESWSLFGDLTFDLEHLMGLEGVELAVGGRYTSDERRSDVLRRTFLGNTPPFGDDGFLIATTSDFQGEETFTDFSPRVSLSWRPDENHNLYASYSQGFKGGGFDPRGKSTIVTSDLDGDGDVDSDDVFEFFLFDPEEVDSYEIGWKAILADGRVSSNIALFYADYTDVQIPGSVGGTDPVTNAPTFFGATTNAGAAEFKGIELEGQWLAGQDALTSGDAFTIGWGLGWIDAEYTEFVTGTPPVDISDDRVVQNTPEFSGALTTNYTRPFAAFGQDGALSVLTQTSHKSETHNFEVRNDFLDQGAYTLFDASLVWTSADDRLQVGVHGKNVFDEEYIIAGHSFLAQNTDGSFLQPLRPASIGLEGIATAFYGPPRTVTGSIRVRF